MAAGIEIEVREIRGPWLNIVVQGIKKHYVMGIITAHDGPGLTITPHTTEPEVFAGMWKLSPYAQESTGGVKLVGVQAELFPQDFKRINGAVRRWRFKVVVDKPSVGFFKVEGIAIVSDGYIAGTKELMEFFDKEPVIVEALLVERIVRKSADGHLFAITPTIGEA